MPNVESVIDHGFASFERFVHKENGGCLDEYLKWCPERISEETINASISGSSRVTLDSKGDAPGEVAFPKKFIYTQQLVLRGDPETFASKSYKKCCACPNTCAGSDGCARDWFNEYQSVPSSLSVGSSSVCDGSCRYCLVEKGSHVDVCIFKTPRTGWGVRANKKIAKGEFIEEYTGEVVLKETSKVNISEKNFYTYSLDNPPDFKFSYEVEASKLGNFTRFINHSCDANVVTIMLLREDDDVTPARLCFFAKEDIGEGEELTVSYNYTVKDVAEPTTISRECYCGSDNCTGYLIRF